MSNHDVIGVLRAGSRTLLHGVRQRKRALSCAAGRGPFGDGNETTNAVLVRSVMLDYWNHNGAEDDGYRERLGLRF